MFNTNQYRDDALPWLTRSIMSKTGEDKNPAAVELGRLGGLKGGPARASALSPERRREIASNAAKVRWARTMQGKKQEVPNEHD